MTALRVQSGNANEDAQPYRGWLIGHFVAGPEPQLRRQTDVEIRWTTHVAGETRPSWVRGETTTTITLLINGRFRIQFSDDPREDVTLARQGDYALWPPGVDHRWTALEDSMVVTVRWPSRPDRSW
jgi:hypothetical protein